VEGESLVYLKRLEVRGFKSFGPSKVVIGLDKGLTVITGPNGSGKSNILDAVRFVLGDLSARSLRTDKMSGVIFDGIPGKDASLNASVTLHLDNDDRRIPIDTETVTLTRKVNREGESEYLLNGRPVSRGQLVDILRIASISSSGYNMIMQGTITRLADITPEERRNAIEDLVGIAEYDAKRAEARVQLQQADTNLRIASARIGDVQARLGRLEEERNDALRYNFIQNEMTKLQATLVSYRLLSLQDEKVGLADKFKQQSEEARVLKEQYDKLLSERNGIESGRRKFDEEIVDEGNARLVNVQRTIGDLMAHIASFKMEVDSGKAGLRELMRLREDRTRQLEVLEQKIREARQNYSVQKNQRDSLKKVLDGRSADYSSVSSSLVEMKQNLERNTAALKEVEDALNDMGRQMMRLNAQLQGHSMRQRILEDNLKTLEKRRDNFGFTLTDFQQHFEELQKLCKSEQEGLVQLSESIDRSISRGDILKTELDEADLTVKMAKDTVVEFEAQKTLAEQVASEEYSLQRIEEMGRLGAIPRIYGRVESLIKISLKFQNAIEAASAGWLKSVVVKDLETALRCVESLKRMKLGRIKVIPLEELRDIGVVEAPEIEGVLGSAASLVRCDEMYVSVVNFIFGDTVVTSGEKSAFLVSRAGYRAVDLNGDLYETSGGIVGGYYREPINFASLFPNEKAMGNLSQSVKSLETILKKRKKDIDSINDDAARLVEERIRRTEIINSIEKELKVIEYNMLRTRQNIAVLDKRIDTLGKHYENEKALQLKRVAEREDHRKYFSGLASKKRALRQSKPELLAKYEKDQTQLNMEISDLNREFVKIESDVNFLENSLNSILVPGFESAKRDISNTERQITSLQDRIFKAQQSLDEANKQVLELEKSKEELSTSLSSVRDRRKEFEEQLDKIDAQLRKVNQTYDPLNGEIHALELEIQRGELDIKRLEEELLSLGYERHSDIGADEVKRAEASIRLMRLELERIGSVNQLAISQYEDQKDSYKQLSIRQNELEKEKKSIIDFMEEIERRKREAFMQAFKSINENFAEFFSRLTGGGEGYLSLQNSEDPFAGGVDIFAQFPGKAIRLIAGASGGEKSTTAVAFIFAIQNLFPAPFYVFDEIDAHLDPYNSERLADLLKGQSASSQFIVLTLRDVIMDRAERLLGVYIQNGVSRVVSTRIAVAAA